MKYKFPESFDERPVAKPKAPKAKLKMVSDEGEPPMAPIRGYMPDSVDEWRLALALDHYKIDYYYQYAIGGGRGGKQFRGGQVIDFLVLTYPLKTPVSVENTFTHPKSRESQLKVQESNLRNHFKNQIKPIVHVDTEKDTKTLRQAMAFVKKEFVG